MISASAGGSAGRMPVARSTASGNFAGCARRERHHRRPAVLRGRPPPARRRPRPRYADRSATRYGGRYRRWCRGSPNRRRGGRRTAPAPRARPAHRRAARRSREPSQRGLTAAPLRPFNSNSRRSKLLATWMSMLGLRLAIDRRRPSSRRCSDSAPARRLHWCRRSAARSAGRARGRDGRHRRCRNCRSAR